MARQKVLTKPAKGTRDFLPADVRRREHVVGVIRDVYEAHGFEPLETPTFERLDTLLGKYGDEGDQLVFKILHRGQPLVKGIRAAAEHLLQDGAVVVGRSGETAPGAEGLLSDLGLRYDLTVPLARVVAEYPGKLPPTFKRYQIQPVWRADTPGKGRFREFYQCDVDIVGSSSRVVEAEVAGAVAQCIERLGFESFDIRLNHRALLRALVDHCGIDPTLESAAIVAIDKLDKIGRDGVDAELEQKGITTDARSRLLDIVTGPSTLDALASSLADHEEGASAVADLREVVSFASATPAADHLKFDVSLARGLGYYTGSIFEIAVEDLAGSLGGGGRYDGLIGMFCSREVPACGFSIGLERIIVVMEQRGMFAKTDAGVDILLAAADPSVVADALTLAYELRSNGLRVDLAPKVAKPSKLRKSAHERQLPRAAWLERDGVLKLWSLASGETEDVPRAELVTRLSE